MKPTRPVSHGLLPAQKLAALRGRLLARIERRYPVVTQVYAVGALRLPFTRVAEPDRVLDQICQKQDHLERQTGQRANGNELHLPYWAELWDSAFGIGEFLAGEGTSAFRGPARGARLNELHSQARPASGAAKQYPLPPRVLDLGCGMGFTGMVAAAMGAHVVLADLEADALLFAQLNSLPWSFRVRARQLNWQSDRLNERFDGILGADVLYDRSQWEFLEPFFRAHLNNNGTVLLGEPGRQTGDDFPEWIQSRCWKLRRIQQRIPGREKPIRIFELHL